MTIEFVDEKVSLKVMVPIQHESNIEVLRSYSLWLTKEVEKLSKENSELKGKADTSRQEFLNKELEDQLVRLRQKFFGFGREERKGQRPVGHRDEQLKMHGQRWQTEAERELEKTGKAKDPGGETRTLDYSFSEKELVEEAQDREISKAEAKAWDEMKGVYQTSQEITVIERVYQKVIHRQKKYRLKDEYNTTGKEVIITAPGPVKLKPGCQYSVDMAVSVVCDKYEIHLPLERQRRQMEAAGLDIDVKTLFSLCQSVSEHCEGDLLERIRLDIFSDFCGVHLDESPWPIIGSDQTSYMWALSNRVGSYYQFEPTRSGKVALEIIEGYQGSVLTDGYSGYNRLKNVEGLRVGNCWSHARREFYERYDDFPKQVTEALELIDKLFDIEAKAKTFEELRALRKKESKEVIDKFLHWCFETRPQFLPGDGIVKAIDYCLKYWIGLTMFLKDLSLPLSNNDAERALRHIVIGRNNFTGSKSINGADVAATLYTVIESAKKVGLRPREYLKYVITERWYKRTPLTPAQLSAQKFGKNKRVVFPEKNQWEI